MAGELTPAAERTIAPAEHLPTRGASLGERSRRLKRFHRMRRMARAVIAAVAVWIGALVAGFAMNGLGVSGLIATFFLVALVFVLFLSFPRLRAPQPGDLRGGDLKTLAGRTELFLEAQRPLLPAPAIPLLDRIGSELDQLAPQLQTLGEGDPAADDVRRLLGDHLPGLIETYARIPESLRTTDNAGATPQQQLIDGLTVISGEIAAMTGNIARGELDALATRGRYLETKYAGGGAGGEG